MSLNNLLEKGCRKLGIDLDSEQTARFLKYLELINIWNSKINLTSISDESEIVIKHFLDSLTVSEFVKDGTNVLDIGTGAGFPGVPLAIVNEKSKFTLLDSREKRIFFINEVIRDLKLENIETVAARAEDSNNGIQRNRFDCVLTRAVSDIGEVLNLSAPYLSENGQIVLMRGKEGRLEWESFKNNEFKLQHIRELKVPESNFLRVLIILSRK